MGNPIGQQTGAKSMAVVLASDQPSLSIGSSSATSATVPANAFYIAGINASGNLQGIGTADRQADSATGTVSISTSQETYNGSTYDRFRNNTSGVIVPAGTTTTQSAVAVVSYNANKLVVVVSITAGSGNVTVSINGVTSSNYSYPILTSTALTGVTTTPLRVFPGAAPSANAVANDVVPRKMTVTATVTGTITYGIDYILIV